MEVCRYAVVNPFVEAKHRYSTHPWLHNACMGALKYTSGSGLYSLMFPWYSSGLESFCLFQSSRYRKQSTYSLSCSQFEIDLTSSEASQHIITTFECSLMSFLSATELDLTTRTTILEAVYNKDQNYVQRSKMFEHLGVVLKFSILVFVRNSYYC